MMKTTQVLAAIISIFNQQVTTVLGIPTKPDVDKHAQGPNWLITPEDTFIVGHTPLVWLECKASADPPVQYAWTRDGSADVVTNDWRYDVNHGNLTIFKPKDTDAGLFQCAATNQVGTILSPPARLSFAPPLLELSTGHTVDAMDYMGAVIECPLTSIGGDYVHYSWMKVRNNYGILDFIRPEITPYLFISRNGKLYFSEVTVHDEAMYICIATMISPGEDLNYVLPQGVPPSNTSQPVVFNVVRQAGAFHNAKIHDNFINVIPAQPLIGDDVILECFAYGSLPLVYNWSHPNSDTSRITLLDNSRVLSIKNISLADFGEYTCTVQGSRTSSSNSKRFNLQLASKPTIRNELADQSSAVGSQMTWTCDAQGVPTPTYAWYKNGQGLQDSQDGKVTVNGNTLELKNLAKQDAGMYQCAASNIHGTAMSSAQLRVLDG